MYMVKKQPEITTVVGNNIRAIRTTRGLTRERLAELLGISSNALLKVEQGNIAPRFKRLEHMAAILECSVADFFIVPDDTTQARAQSIAKMLEPLPAHKQEDAMHLIRRFLALIDGNRPIESMTETIEDTRGGSEQNR